MDWFRSHHGAPTDPKWIILARRANATERNRTQINAGMVASVFWALMDYASQHRERGSVAGFDAEAIAGFYGYEQADVEAIIEAMNDKNIIENNRLSAWDRRQPKREDGSAERAKAWRDERKRTQANANEHRLEEIREEKKEEDYPPKPPLKRGGSDTAEFLTFWEAYPHKVGKPAARTKFAIALRKADLETILAGLDRYKRSKPPDREWCHPTTWLSQERWNDQPAPLNGATGKPNGHAQPKRWTPPAYGSEEWKRDQRRMGLLNDGE